MANPKPRERTGRVDLRLHPDNKTKLERIAAAKRRTVTSIIDEIIEGLPEPEEQRK